LYCIVFGIEDLTSLLLIMQRLAFCFNLCRLFIYLAYLDILYTSLRSDKRCMNKRICYVINQSKQHSHIQMRTRQQTVTAHQGTGKLGDQGTDRHSSQVLYSDPRQTLTFMITRIICIVKRIG